MVEAEILELPLLSPSLQRFGIRYSDPLIKYWGEGE